MPMVAYLLIERTANGAAAHRQTRRHLEQRWL
jgi:hypothetical protein